MASNPSPTSAEARLRALPEFASSVVATPAGRYARFSEAHGLLASSGVVGRENGVVIRGALINASSVPLGERAARAATIAILRAAADELGGLERVAKVVALTGYLNAAVGFESHIDVMNAASAVIADVFADQPMPARTTVGVTSLPGGGAVEVSLTLQLRPVTET